MLAYANDCVNVNGYIVTSGHFRPSYENFLKKIGFDMPISAVKRINL